MKVIKDTELREYQDNIGAEAYRQQYQALYLSAKNHQNKRASGRKYQNTPEKLQRIKDKYKSGVTPEILKEWLHSGDRK